MKAATYTQTPPQCGRWISIHAAREGGDYYAYAYSNRNSISIHAAREGGDILERKVYVHFGISIHAAREGGDIIIIIIIIAIRYFNPRRP